MFPGAQYTVYIAVGVEIDVVSQSRKEGYSAYEMLKRYVFLMGAKFGLRK